MPHPEPRRSPRTFVTRVGVAALGLAVGVGGLGWPAPAHAAVIDGLAGTGTAADPVVIDSAADLDLVAARVNADHATYGSLSYRLDADVDYAGGTFETFRQFSGTFDGNAHAIRDLTLRPGTIADAADAAATQTGFVQVLSNGTIADLTLEGLTSATTGSTTARVQQGGFVGRSSGGTVTGSSLVDSSVTSSPNTDNSAAVGGFVGKTVGTATTTLTDNVLRGTTVSGDKRVGGLVGWANISATVQRNLVVETDVAHAGASGAGAAFLVGHTVCAGDVGDNVVVSGSISQVGPASYGWVRTGTGCSSSDNLVNSANNIDPAGPVGHTAAPDPNPFAVYWQGSALLSASGWTAADLGTYTSPAALAEQATYEARGWVFDETTADTAAATTWRWDDVLGHPVRAAAEAPGRHVITYLLDGGTNGANPTSYEATSEPITLAPPTRTGYTFTGWTGTGLTGPTPTVTIPTGSTGDREYTAHWQATAYALGVDLGGGTLAEAAPSSYTIESGDITLPTPTRQGHVFGGWTGTGLVGPTAAVTIPTGSSGDRAYVATWALEAAPIAGVDGEGTAEKPYLVGDAADLAAVAAAVNTDYPTFGARHVELAADVDLGGATFAGFHRFSGVFDGAGHTIAHLTVAPWLDGDSERVAFFGRLDGATVTGLTLRGVTALKSGTTLPAGAAVAVTSGLTTMATSSTVDRVAVLDATVRNESAQGENPYDAGFIARVAGTEAAPTRVTDSMVGGATTVYSAGKYVSGFIGYLAAHTTISRNLVAADPDAGHLAENAAGGANMNASVLVNYGGAGMDGQEIAENVVYSGSVLSYATGTTGNTVSWIAGYNHAQVDRYGTNLVNGDHNRVGFPGVAETAPAGHLLRWTRRAGTAYAHSVANLWVLGNDGTAASLEQLRAQATYEGLGWDFDTVWQWDDEAQHPVLRAAEAPVVEPPAITVGTASISYQVGSTPTAADVLERLGASVDRGTLALDLGGVDFTTPGTYQATVTASDGDDVAAPVAVTIVVSELDGAGTDAEPYVVASAADLDAAADMVNDDVAQTGAAAAHYELAADVDYAGGTFETFRHFSGVLDGNGHEISDLTLRPGTVADAGDAGATQTGFVQVLSGAITDLTLRGLRSVTAGSSTDRVQQGGFAGRAAGATITGSALIGSTVSSADNTDNSSAVGGLVGKSTGAGTTLADNLLAGVAVNGDKRVGGALGWANVAVDVRRTLVLDTSVTQNGSSGAGAAFVTGHSVCAGSVNGNVVLSGTIRQTSPANYGWIAAAETCTGTGNLVNASNNIDVDTPVGHTSAPNPNPHAVFWSGSTTLDTAGAWTRGVLGAYASRDDLAQRATYEAVGYDLSSGGAWRWDDERRHPVPAGVAFPSVDVVVDLDGGTDGGANPTTHGFALDAALANPTREGYVFAGWTGSGIEGTSLAVTLPRYPAGDLHYTATWTPTAFVIGYDLAGGTVPAGNPVMYSVDSAAFTLVNPTRDGYTFVGWSGTGIDGTSTAVTVAQGSTGARSFTAVWTPIGYPVTYDLAGGTAGGDNPATYTVESAAFTLANPTRAGYAFAGWTGTGLTSSTATVVVPAGSSQARSYVATWTPVVFHIVYGIEDDADFSGPVPGTYTIESAAITVPRPVRPGHVFAGWTGTGLTSPTMVVTIAAGSTGTRTYTPTWHRINAITYRLAGGRLARTNPTTYLETSPAFTLANPTRPGYRFAGWAGLGATSTRLTVPTGTTGDLVLTATWTRLARSRSAVQVRWVRKPTRQRAGRLAFAVPAVSGYPTPTGRVTVRVTGKVTRTVTTGVRAGWTTVTLPRKLPAGRYRVTATFAGNAFYALATSKTLTFRVKK